MKKKTCLDSVIFFFLISGQNIQHTQQVYRCVYGRCVRKRLPNQRDIIVTAMCVYIARPSTVWTDFGVTTTVTSNNTDVVLTVQKKKTPLQIHGYIFIVNYYNRIIIINKRGVYTYLRTVLCAPKSTAAVIRRLLYHNNSEQR